jgi:hypothetical protein
LKADLKELPDSFDDGKNLQSSDEIESIPMSQSSFMSRIDVGLIDDKYGATGRKNFNMSTLASVNNCSLR